MLTLAETFIVTRRFRVTGMLTSVIMLVETGLLILSAVFNVTKMFLLNGIEENAYSNVKFYSGKHVSNNDIIYTEAHAQNHGNNNNNNNIMSPWCECERFE